MVPWSMRFHTPEGNPVIDNALTVETHDDGAALTIAVIGRVDGNTVRSLESAVQGLAGTPQPAVVVDLERMTYVSSAGLQVFLLTAQQVRKAGGKVVFCSLADNILKVFKVSGFDRILTVRETKEEALKLF